MQRLKICIGAAKGLNYLHSGLGEHRVIHRDVKSANILLDENLVAKVCDFGLSKFGSRNQPDSQVYTKVAGTQFYMDPTYHESAILRKESDVYSFGVVLFEMLSGLLVYSTRSIGNDKPQTLMHLVRRYHKEPVKLIDPDIRDHENNDSFHTFMEIAYQCISLDLTKRPMMYTVLEMIEKTFGIQDPVAILMECVKENIGFCDDKPVAAFTIYKTLLHYKYLEAERTNVVDRLIQTIIRAIEDQDDNNKMAYWLSNASNLLFLIHKSHGVTPQISPVEISGLEALTMGFRSPFFPPVGFLKADFSYLLDSYDHSHGWKGGINKYLWCSKLCFS